MINDLTSAIHKDVVIERVNLLIKLLENRTSDKYKIECYIYFDVLNIVIHNKHKKTFKKIIVSLENVLEKDLSELSFTILKYAINM